MNYMRAIRIGLVILVGLFLYGCGSPAVTEAPAATPTQELPTQEPLIPTEEIATEEPAIDPLGTGDAAPDFTLPDSNGNMVRLTDELLDNRLVILVFYFHHT